MDMILRWIIAFVSVFAAFVPMVGYLLLIWWMDRYLRQPLWMVGGVFLWGALGAVLIGVSASQFFEVPMAQILGREATHVIGSILIAPVVEEISKACILLLIALRTDFNGPADGIVLGAAAGLGFGMTENFFYFNQVYDQSGFFAWLQNVYVRTFYSALVHCVCTAMVGMAIGFAKSRSQSAVRAAFFWGFPAAMIIHSFWNASMVIGSLTRNTWLVQAGFTVLPVLVIVLFALYQISLFREGQIIRMELEEESELGTLPASHVPILVSYFARNRKEWCPANVPRNIYIGLAMRLGMKRRQWKEASGFRKERLDGVVQDLRNQVKTLLSF